MSLQSALHEIESHEFSARLGVANNMQMFVTLAEHEQTVKELIDLLKNVENANKLLVHVSSLLREQEDVRYRSTRDAAVAVCILALKQSQPALARLLASHVLTVPRFWWARKAAIEFSDGTLAKSDSGPDGFLVMKQDGWTNSNLQGKDVLVVPDTAAALISSSRIAGPNSITATSDAIGSSTDLPREMTASSSLTETLTEVV